MTCNVRRASSARLSLTLLTFLMGWISVLSPAAVEPDIVWQPTPQVLAAMRAACSSSAPAKYSECLVSQMAPAGAAPAAVAFTRMLKERTGQIAYARELHDTRPVGVVFVEYMLRANESQGWFLVNGDPPLIDVDDLRALPLASMRGDQAYASLAARYPRVMLFPGDRGGNSRPEIESLPDRGQRIIVAYRLLNGCHACQRLALARFAFDFDRSGRLSGARFLNIDEQQ